MEPQLIIHADKNQYIIGWVPTQQDWYALTYNYEHDRWECLEPSDLYAATMHPTHFVYLEEENLQHLRYDLPMSKHHG